MEDTTYDADGMWEKEEMEDLISKGIIAIYDTKLNKQCRSNWIKPQLRISERDLVFVRKKGLYICPDDRCVLENYYDIKNDGILDSAVWCDEHGPVGSNNDLIRGYLNIFYARRINKIPPGWHFDKIPTHLYELICFMPQESNKGAWACRNICGLTNEGYGVNGYIYSVGQFGKIKDYLPTPLPTGECKPVTNLWLTFTLSFYADKRFLWNVTAKEGDAKVTFGVHEQQIKSLLYARDLPLSKTGRKRPILHWVASHRRRVKAGTDVDIAKHLRGITEFEMNGTQFSITNPQKKDTIQP